MLVEEAVAVMPMLGVKQVTLPLWVALTTGWVVSPATKAVSLPLQPVDGFWTVKVYIPGMVTTGFCCTDVYPLGPVQL